MQRAQLSFMEIGTAGFIFKASENCILTFCCFSPCLDICNADWEGKCLCWWDDVKRIVDKVFSLVYVLKEGLCVCAWARLLLGSSDKPAEPLRSMGSPKGSPAPCCWPWLGGSVGTQFSSLWTGSPTSVRRNMGNYVSFQASDSKPTLSAIQGIVEWKAGGRS